MKSEQILLLAALTVLVGCATPQGYYTIGIGNSSGQELNFVTLHSGGTRSGFGYLGKDNLGRHPAKTAGDSHLVFDQSCFIEYQANGSRTNSSIDMSKFARVRNDAQQFNFNYIGDGRWNVQAVRNRGLESDILAEVTF